MTWSQGRYLLSDAKEDQHAETIHAMLKTTYWASTRPIHVVEQLLDVSLCFSLFDDGLQIGFVRAVSDYVRITWIADMIIDDRYRGQGLGQWVMECVMDHPRLKTTQFALQTLDAHSFYEKLGFMQRPSLMSTAIGYL